MILRILLVLALGLAAGRADIPANEASVKQLLEPIRLRIYEKSLAEDEVQDMMVFYMTPAGRGVINKIPLIMQNSMAEVGQMTGPMLQRIGQMHKEMVAERV